MEKSKQLEKQIVSWPMQKKLMFFWSFRDNFLFFTAADNYLYDVLCKSDFMLVLMPVLTQAYLAWSWNLRLFYNIYHVFTCLAAVLMKVWYVEGVLFLCLAKTCIILWFENEGGNNEINEVWINGC